MRTSRFRVIFATVATIGCLWFGLTYLSKNHGVSFSAATPPTPARAAAQATYGLTLESFAQTRDVQVARDGFAKAISQDPSYSQARFDLALIEESNDNWDGAIEQLTEVQRLESESQLGKVAAKELAHVKQIKKLWTTPEGRKSVEYERAVGRGRALITAGAVDDALNEASSAIRLDASRYEAHCVAADALNKLHRFAAAAAHVREAMHLAPSALQPKLQQALKEVQDSEAFDNESQAGDQALEDKDYGTAGDHYLAAYKILPTREAVALRGATMLALADRLDDAKPVLEKLVASADPRIVREAVAQLKSLQTFQRQQQMSREADTAMAKMRHDAGLPPEPAQSAATITKPRPSTPRNPTPAGSSDAVSSLIDRISPTSSTPTTRSIDVGKSPTTRASHDSVLDLITPAGSTASVSSLIDSTKATPSTPTTRSTDVGKSPATRASHDSVLDLINSR